MAELVDAHGSGPCAFGCGGSSPLLGTKQVFNDQIAFLIPLPRTISNPAFFVIRCFMSYWQPRIWLCQFYRKIKSRLSLVHYFPSVLQPKRSGNTFTQNIHQLVFAVSTSLLLAGCEVEGNALCGRDPVMVIETRGGGSEDMVVLPLDQTGDITRLFIREQCNDGSDPLCKAGQWRLGRADISWNNTTSVTHHAWRPGNTASEDHFEPLGMSLVPGNAPGEATLFVIDIARPKLVRIWQLRITGGEITEARLATPANAAQTGARLATANSLQAIHSDESDGFHLFVTRFDEYGLLPFRPTPWPALVQIRNEQLQPPAAQDFRNANGIIQPCKDCDLIIASYWERRLRFASKTSGKIGEYASAELPIRPDNLRLDGERILIAGQRRVDLTALNLLVSSRIPSPSAVYAINTRSLGPDTHPTLLWEGGWKYGHSVATAVALPGNRLAIGQINTPSILIADCSL